MKIYLVVVILLTILGEFYVIRLIDSYRPTEDLFTKSVDVSADIVEEDRGKGGLVPTINGGRLACGVSYRGITRQCRSYLHTMKSGVKVTGSMILFPTLTGPVWVPISVQLGDGSVYRVSHDEIMARWDSDSRKDLYRLPIYALIILVGMPLLLKSVVQG